MEALAAKAAIQVGQRRGLGQALEIRWLKQTGRHPWLSWFPFPLVPSLHCFLLAALGTWRMEKKEGTWPLGWLLNKMPVSSPSPPLPESQQGQLL